MGLGKGSVDAFSFLWMEKSSRLAGDIYEIRSEIQFGELSVQIVAKTMDGVEVTLERHKNLGNGNMYIVGGRL